MCVGIRLGITFFNNIQSLRDYILTQYTTLNHYNTINNILFDLLIKLSEN